MFEFFVARRYLRAKRKQVVISVITVISVIGVAAGVMALVIALAITNGFSSTLQRNLLGATAACFDSGKEPGERDRGLGTDCGQACRGCRMSRARRPVFTTPPMSLVRCAAAARSSKGVSSTRACAVPDALVRI